jgi:hypothetical protein
MRGIIANKTTSSVLRVIASVAKQSRNTGKRASLDCFAYNDARRAESNV